MDRQRIFAENLADGKWVLPLEFLSITPDTGEKIQNYTIDIDTGMKEGGVKIKEIIYNSNFPVWRNFRMLQLARNILANSLKRQECPNFLCLENTKLIVMK